MTLRDALDAVIADHELNGRQPQLYRAAALRRLFPLDEAEPTVPMLMAYAKARMGEGMKPATVNRELGMLRRGCYLVGINWPKRWSELKESAPRQGFATRAEVERVCEKMAHLPSGYADLARFCFLTGWRRGEALRLRWSEVDLAAGEVRLLAGTTKNGEPRVFPLYPQLRELLERRAASCDVRPDGHVFDRGNGLRLFSLAYRWRRACIAAGLPNLLLHDFRRSAARNLIEAGVDRQVAMKLLGHKTEGIFNRYRITTKRELVNAADKLSRLLD